MEQLVKRAMKHDADAFLELMERYSDQMYKTAWSILKNDADVADAMQDTIVTCYEKIDTTIVTCYEKIDTLRQPQYFRECASRIRRLRRKFCW